MAKKISQKTIKQLIKEGAAIDLSAMYGKKNYPKAKEFDVIAISYGIYGMNGALLMRKGKLYGIASRNTALFYYV